MQVAVVSNCQGEGIATALQLLNPGMATKFVLSTELAAPNFDKQALIDGTDFFLVQDEIPALASVDPAKVVYFPNVSFDGYHPDIIFVRGRNKDTGTVEAITTDMVIYHSAICLFGYKNDIPAAEIVNYFNHFVFSRLGYTDRWQTARAALLAEGNRVNMPLSAEFYRWSQSGPFMYSSNHPHARVLVDVAKRILEKLNIPAVNESVADYMPDALRDMPIWPVYPALATHLGVSGSFTFKRHHPHGTLTLLEFIENCYAKYDLYEKDSLESLMMSPGEVALRLNAPADDVSSGNPYKGADSRQFWKNSVELVEPGQLDPVFDTKFGIAKTDRVATAGSCFAQHIARTLSRSGFNYYVPESAPSDLSEEEASRRNYGVFSARYGNVYTVRQLVQLIDRAFGRFAPDELFWTRKDGRIVDPFRPQIEPDGFDDVAALKASRDAHFASIREMITTMDVFVFTLGLTEGWRSKVDGAVFPLAPGVAGGSPDKDRYEFVNFTIEETTFDLFRAIDLIRAVNPDCRFIVTVSPVPLIATFEPRHALVSTVYSKSTLRAAAQRVADTFDDVQYFGSYEIITGSYNRGAYFHDNLRDVTEEGVGHVMGIFMKHFAGSDSAQPAPEARKSTFKAESNPLFDVVCDEEAITNF